MKYIAVLFFLVLALSQNSEATTVRCSLLRNPETNLKVLAIGDVHLESESEQEHRKAVIEFLASNENWHLAAEDMCTESELTSETGCQQYIEGCWLTGFLLGLVEQARQNNIDAYSVEIRTGTCDVKDFHERARNLSKVIEYVKKGSLPEQYKDILYALQSRGVMLELCGAVCANHLNWNDHPRYLTAFNDVADEIGLDLINCFALAHVLEKVAKKNVMLCMGDDHIVFVRKRLKELGFEEVDHVVSYETEEQLFNDLTNHTVDLPRLLKKFKTA